MLRGARGRLLPGQVSPSQSPRLRRSHSSAGFCRTRSPRPRRSPVTAVPRPPLPLLGDGVAATRGETRARQPRHPHSTIYFNREFLPSGEGSFGPRGPPGPLAGQLRRDPPTPPRCPLRAGREGAAASPARLLHGARAQPTPPPALPALLHHRPLPGGPRAARPAPSGGCGGEHPLAATPRRPLRSAPGSLCTFRGGCSFPGADVPSPYRSQTRRGWASPRHNVVPHRTGRSGS